MFISDSEIKKKLQKTCMFECVRSTVLVVMGDVVISAEDVAYNLVVRVKNVGFYFYPTHLLHLPFFICAHSHIVCLQCMLGGFEVCGQGASGSAAESRGMSLLLPGSD